MLTCPNCREAINVAATSPHVLADLKSVRTRGTATETQEARLLAALRLGPKTTDDLRKLGLYQASARVWGLRQRGFVIETDLFDGYSADGYSHARMARYTLKEEPLPLDVKQAQEGPKSGRGAPNGAGVAC